MHNAIWWRIGASMAVTSLVVSAIVTAPTLLLNGNARWWGVVAGLGILVTLVTGLSRFGRRIAASERSITKPLRMIGTGSFDAKPVPYPDGFDAERFLNRQLRRARLINLGLVMWPWWWLRLRRLSSG